jgi:site-specific recombinase XerD
MLTAPVEALGEGGFAVVTGNASGVRAPQPELLARYADRVSGPLAGLAGGYAAYLAGRGYASSSVRQHLGLMADLSTWLGEQGLGPDGISPPVADRFAAWAGTRRTYLATARSLAPLLGYLRSEGVLPEPAPVPEDARALLLAEYRQYLRAERGLAGTTIRDYAMYAAEFAAALEDSPGTGLAALSGARVLDIVPAQARRRRPPSAGAVMNAARSFLRFLYRTGRIPRPLAQVVPSAARRQPRLPGQPDAAAVTALLDSCDRQTEAGLRDYAVLVLLRRYGARGIEVTRLRLADLRWRAGEIVLRGKGGRADVLPLMHDAGEAVASYLQARRDPPPGTREVFLTVCAPSRPLHRATVHGIVARACERAGVPPAGPRAFRHALGCRLLAAGASLADVRDVLRHSDVVTTAGYARPGPDALAALVRPWPGSQPALAGTP